MPKTTSNQTAGIRYQPFNRQAVIKKLRKSERVGSRQRKQIRSGMSEAANLAIRHDRAMKEQAEADAEIQETRYIVVGLAILILMLGGIWKWNNLVRPKQVIASVNGVPMMPAQVSPNLGIPETTIPVTLVAPPFANRDRST